MQEEGRKLHVIFTIGHSTRSLGDFVDILRAHGVEHIIDIRTVPRSRHNPQFNRDTLAIALRTEGIGYTHLKELGGLRRARPDSANQGWRSASFRGFADYMQTPEFEEGLERALRLSSRKRTALMCAEAVPWRCHRSLVADALVARQVPLEHILSISRTQPHSLTPFARVRDGQITYPPEGDGQGKPRERSRGGIEVARVYDEDLPKKGARFLIERLWPRGMRKEQLKLAAWLKDVAPGEALRRWFSHRSERWAEFRKRYLAELRRKPESWQPILEAARRGPVILLYNAHDRKHNSALVLRKFLRDILPSINRQVSK
jgi:uncharacterized protein YeaO (DUF488 family)